ncbi:MAG: RnfH family protein [Pseudomonadota bacterium]
MAIADTLTIEVAYANGHEETLLTLSLALGSTVADAVRASALSTRFPEIDLTRHRVGIFGKLVTLDRVLEAADRVEIYRPLIADPKEQRKKRAAQGKTMRKGSGDLPLPNDSSS